MYKTNVYRFLSMIFVFLLSMEASAEIWPITEGQGSAPLTSAYGPRLISGHYDFHYGVDIRTSASTTVIAAHNGFVDWRGTNGIGYGRMIFLGEDNYSQGMYASGYAHLESYTVALDSAIWEGDQIAVSGGSPPHLHFNYYTRNVYESFIQDFHPVDANADHPMDLLPYTNYSGPSFDNQTSEGPGDGLTSIGLDVLTSGTELDLNFLELRISGEPVLADFGLQQNINRSDGTNPNPETQTTIISYASGQINLIITVFSFSVGEQQRMHLEYDFSNYNDGTFIGSVPSEQLVVYLGDVKNYWTMLPPFTSGIVPEGGLK
ncbi:MAG: M23 family metallopeptidase [Candidatus Marinimicrobia bacterium]|nr:M23 family metallopeptidase [Candidatus Neomarinimicrobiota bacterium]